MRHHRRRWLWTVPLLIILYLIIGAVFPFLTYKNIDPKEQLLPGLSAMLEPSSGESVDRVMLLETNESAWEERIRLMNQARERIILSTFDMRDGESTRDLLALILEKADEGVKVRILVDGFSGTVRMTGRDLFRAVSSHPNIEIRHYNPLNLLEPWKTQGRMHDKYVIVDDLGYILGGRNTFDYFIGNYDSRSKSHDREVLIYNTAHGDSRGAESSLYQVERYFDGVWNLEVSKPFDDEEELQNRSGVRKVRADLRTRLDSIRENRAELFEEPDYLPLTVEAEGICLVSNPTGLYGKEPMVFWQLTELMRQAGAPVAIHTPYLVCNTYMRERLKEINQSVPDMRIVFNSVENGDNFFASSDYMRRKKELLTMGIPLYEYDGGMSTHGKSVVIGDDICAVGSYNFDLRSSYLDTELMLVIRSRDFTAQLEGKLDEIEKDCRLALNEKEYLTPSHVTVAKIPLPKKLAMKFVGLIMQPFRFLI